MVTQTSNGITLDAACATAGSTIIIDGGAGTLAVTPAMSWPNSGTDAVAGKLNTETVTLGFTPTNAGLIALEPPTA